VVIVHTTNPIEHLSREQVVDIYMGRYTHFPDGHTALPIDMAVNSSLREAYYEKLINKTVAQVNSFWARLLFSGRATPPAVLPDAQAVNEFVIKNKNAIAYIDSQSLNEKTKVVFRLP
jgi:ABC-type phosphate transport system substrate-binding protein